MRKVINLILLVAACLLVFFITKSLYAPATSTEQISSTVLLERVRPVLKLVTVEGDFNELFTYRSSDATFEWMQRFSPFQKKAILRVKGRASVGYDLEGLDLSIDEDSRTITLLGMDKPKLLSLEHDVDYYDIEAGAFASFSAADHTRINAQAKELIRGKVPGSGLFEAAEAQRNEMLMVLRAVLENSGWRFEEKLDRTGPLPRPLDR
ncbi:MAG: DUF4230 domain-containing protein [Flavobacteriales bacterium]|nr:DUF4230 domain-containing protein [Flavobacteriales bacterium]